MKRVLSVIFMAFIICSLAAVTLAGQTPSAPQDKTQQATTPADKKDDKKEVKKEEDCGCEAKTPPPDVLAEVNGVKISIKDVDEAIRSQVEELQKQVIEARQQELNVLINSKLLDAEAKKRGTTADEMIKTEIVAKITEPTEAEAQAFYNQNKSQIQGEFAEVKGQIINYLRGLKEQELGSKLAQQLRAAADVKVLVEDVLPPVSEADRARVLATINGAPITSGEVEDSLKPIIAEVQEQIYTLRQRQVELRINDMLLEAEAKKRNVTGQALFESEVLPKTKKVTEEEAQVFYTQNKEKINGEYAQLKDQIIKYLQEIEQDKAETAFADQLRKGAKVQIFLTPPDPPAYQIAIDDQPWKGGANAPVTIVEFTDYECPSCAFSQPALDEVVKEFGDKVKLVARDYPLSMHAHAAKAAEAAEAAREQGKYWEYTALLFQNQGKLEIENLKQYATQLQLDRKKFDEALDSGKFADKVQRDLQDGYKIGVNSTPSVFINGKRVRDRTKESLKAAIEAALKELAKK